MSDRDIREQERKLRADDFHPPEDVEDLIQELEGIVADYHEGMTLVEIQSEWNAARPRLKRIFHEQRTLPEFIVERIPSS